MSRRATAKASRATSWLNRTTSAATFRTLRFLLRTVGFRYFKLRHEGAEHIRRDGPFILAPVHRSHLDAPLIGSLTHRQVRYLGKEELFAPRPLGWLMRAVGTFPVRRGDADLDAMRAASALLNDGSAMLVFPEGTRQQGDDIGEIFDGTAWLAARTGVEVVPIGVAGTSQALPSGAKFPKRTQVAIAIGEPLAPPVAADGGKPKRADLRAWSISLRDAMARQQARARELADA